MVGKEAKINFMQAIKQYKELLELIKKQKNGKSNKKIAINKSIGNAWETVLLSSSSNTFLN